MLHVDMTKTKELVFRRPNARNCLALAEPTGKERVVCPKMSGACLRTDLGMRMHREYNIMQLCQQRCIYLSSQFY